MPRTSAAVINFSIRNVTMDIVSELRGLIGAGDDGAVLDAAEVGKRSAGVWRPDNLKGAALIRRRFGS